VETHGSGLTFFEGGYGIRVHGKRKGRASRKRVERLLFKMVEKGFFSMPDVITTTDGQSYYQYFGKNWDNRKASF